MNQLSISLLNKVRNLDSAREAYEERDHDKSRYHHNRGAPSSDHSWLHPEGHMSTSGDILRAIVFGGLDGIVTIFALLSGCVGASVSYRQTVIVCIGNLLADAFAMGFGEYISSKAEDDFILGETAREKWEIKNYPQGERKEMVTLYIEKYGFTEQDAQIYVDIGMQYPDYFLQHMMFEELGLKVLPETPGESGYFRGPLLKGLVMFGSFLCHGFIPLLGFMCLNQTYFETVALTLITLLILGVLKAKLSGSKSVAKAALAMAANGALASAAAFTAATLLKVRLIQSTHFVSEYLTR